MNPTSIDIRNAGDVSPTIRARDIKTEGKAPHNIYIKDVDTHCRTLDEFKSKWIEQGHSIKEETKDTITLVSNDGHEYFCIILGKILFPFEFIY